MNKKIAIISSSVIVLGLVIGIFVTVFLNSFNGDLKKAEQVLRDAGKTDEEITKITSFFTTKKDVLSSMGVKPSDLAKKMTGTEEAPVAPETPTDAVAPETKVDVPEDKNPIATLNIKDMGEMKFELFPMQAPQSVYNFISLANSDFYNGLKFHRVECSEDKTPLVAQGGDPKGDGTGGPDYAIKGEFSSNGVKNDLAHKKGSIAWARSGEPDSAGSQFFINLADNENWNPDYAVFGTLIEGEEVLDSISKECSINNVDGTTTPKKEIIIDSVSVDTMGIEYPQPDKI